MESPRRHEGHEENTREDESLDPGPEKRNIEVDENPTERRSNLS
jgi:hypothetical protein